MLLPETFESLWNVAASEEAFQTLAADLKSWVSEHWNEEPKSIENMLLSLLERGNVAGIKHVLKAVQPLFPLNVTNPELIQKVVELLDDPLPEIRVEAIHILGRLASEHDNAPGLYLTHLMAMLKTETDVSCRGRLLVYAEKAICDAQTRLAKVCLGETADKKLGPWREMSVLGHLQKLRVKWHDWQAFFDKLIAEMESWDRLGWIAFRTLIKSVSFDSSLYRELVERIPELIRIVEVVEYRLELDTNILNRHALIQLIGPMSRRRKRKIVNDNIGFLAKAITYDYPGICRECLEIFLELSTVPLLSSEQRTNLLTHKDDHVRELAEELFEPVFATV